MTTSARAIRSPRDAARQREIDERTAKIEAEKKAKIEAERLKALSETSAMRALIDTRCDDLIEATIKELETNGSDPSWVNRLKARLSRYLKRSQ